MLRSFPVEASNPVGAVRLPLAMFIVVAGDATGAARSQRFPTVVSA
jgi:hypothetical protein